jgi:hypothetical protein
MTFPDLFKRALALWWRTRALWPLGVLAALVGGSDYSTVSFNFNQRVSSDDPGDLLPPELADQLAANDLLRAIIDNPVPWIIGFGAIVLLLSIVFGLIALLAHGSMIRMADRADRGYPAPLGDALRTGAARLLPLFLLGLLLALPTLLIVGAIVVVFFTVFFSVIATALDGDGGNVNGFAVLGGMLFCLVPLVLLSLAYGLVVSIFQRTAQCVCVLEGLGPIASLRRAWALVTRNFGNVILAWLSTTILAGLFSFIVSLPLFAFGIPAMIGFVRDGGIPWGFLIGAGLYSLVVTVLAGGWLTSFNFALWTVVYRSIAGGEPRDPVPSSYAPGD